MAWRSDQDRRTEELTREECLDLLRRGGVGRIVVANPRGSPEVAPVNYVLDGEAVVFRSDLGTKLGLLRAGAATFEVDEVDLVHDRAWSVVVKGHVYEPSHWETDNLRVQPLAGGAKRHWVRLIPSSVTGRRIGTLTQEDP
jgi:nitroimidazol reductase NimA-like FMN-containing flavoprotein (pyridoxamine 5'-phosphate oxidase superfamily)